MSVTAGELQQYELRTDIFGVVVLPQKVVREGAFEVEFELAGEGEATSFAVYLDVDTDEGEGVEWVARYFTEGAARDLAEEITRVCNLHPDVGQSERLEP